MRSFWFFISMIWLLSCGNSKKPMADAGVNADSTINKSVHWLNDDLGIQNAVTFIDTVQRTGDKLFAYGINIVLPKLVGKSSEFKAINSQILADFQPIIDKVKENPKSNQEEYRQIGYDYYLNDSVISIKITDQHAYYLAEGASRFYLYHFDYKNNKLLDTKSVFEYFGWSQTPILSAIAEQATMPPDHSEPLFQTEWFNNVKFKDLNLLKIYLNEKKQITVIYPVIENGVEAEQIIE